MLTEGGVAANQDARDGLAEPRRSSRGGAPNHNAKLEVLREISRSSTKLDPSAQERVSKLRKSQFSDFIVEVGGIYLDCRAVQKHARSKCVDADAKSS